MKSILQIENLPAQSNKIINLTKQLRLNTMILDFSMESFIIYWFQWHHANEINSTSVSLFFSCCCRCCFVLEAIAFMIIEVELINQANETSAHWMFNWNNVGCDVFSKKLNCCRVHESVDLGLASKWLLFKMKTQKHFAYLNIYIIG